MEKVLIRIHPEVNILVIGSMIKSMEKVSQLIPKEIAMKVNGKMARWKEKEYINLKAGINT